MLTREYLANKLHRCDYSYEELVLVFAQAETAIDLRDACQAALDYIPGSEVRSWPPGHDLRKRALNLIVTALAKLETTPPADARAEDTDSDDRPFLNPTNQHKWKRC